MPIISVSHRELYHRATEFGVMKLLDHVFHLVQRVKLDNPLSLRIDLNITRLRILTEEAVTPVVHPTSKSRNQSQQV